MKSKVLTFLQNEIDLKHIPGAVIHVSHQGKVLMQEAIGNKVVYPQPAKMELGTVFDLASLTKVVSTLPAILKLIDCGEIRLDDKVSFFLPDFAKNGKNEITMRHLLTHTSSLAAHRNFYLDHLNSNEIMDEIYSERLIDPLGSKVIYSDLGFITLYKVIEKVTGQKITSFVNKEIFKPLNMLDTGYNPDFPKDRFAATEYSEKLKTYKRGIVHDDNTESMGGISGHAGLFSTVKDLQNFATMIENKGVFDGKVILSEQAIDLSRKCYTPFDSEYRGIGWILKSPTYSSCGDYFSEESYGHTGFTGTSIWFDPSINLHVILLTNRVHFGRKDPIIRLRPRLHNIIRSHF